MLFYLIKLNLVRVLHEDVPTLKEGETGKQVAATIDAWKHPDLLCKNYILNGLYNTLYNVYIQVKTTKEMCDSLEKRYKTEDASMKKFIVGKFLDYIDSKTITSQVQELQIILHVEKMELSESFQVVAIVEKLPSFWKDFKIYLKHKHKEMGLEYLIVRLKIEEDNRVSEKKIGKHPIESKANLVEPKANKKGKHFAEGRRQGKDK